MIPNSSNDSGHASLWAPVRLLNSIPYAIIAIACRIATFSVFFRSGSQKLSDWSATLMLFENEYHVPLIAPHAAAYMAVSVELGCSLLVLVGLATRASVLVLFGLIATIQIFVYPEAWPDHIQWQAFMFVLLARGPGMISLDHLLLAWTRHRRPRQPVPRIVRPRLPEREN